MKPKLVLCLDSVLRGILFGCKSTSNPRVDMRRQHLMAIYQNTTRPMAVQVTAFDNLIETFQAGTFGVLLKKYFESAEEFQKRLGKNVSWFEQHLNSPDGSSGWIILKGELFEDQIVA